NRREMATALRTQFDIYYALPAVPPVLIGVPFILHMAHTPEPGVMVGASSPWVIVITALAVFFLIYAVYIVLAYTSLKRNVLPA
ncbi:MAG: ABC transporter permease, partial [Lawsonibacter sp.]|nr:ABC transporter permease [Lawsonibacter sp.]